MSQSIKDLIRTDDFHQVKHAVVMRNDTSGTNLLDVTQIYVEHYGQDSLSLNCPRSFGQKGHNLTLFFLEYPVREPPKRLPCKCQMEVMGRVRDIDEMDDRCLVDLQLTQLDGEQWEAFLKVYRDRHERLIKIQEDQ